MARSISPGSRTSTGRKSTPSDGAGPDCAELAGAGRYGRFSKDRRARHAGHDLFEQLQPFPGDGIFEIGEARGVAARARQALDVASADRVGDNREHDRNGTGRLISWPVACR